MEDAPCRSKRDRTEVVLVDAERDSSSTGLVGWMVGCVLESQFSSWSQMR